VSERARAYAANLSGILADARERRNDRLEADWGPTFGSAGVARQERWERAARPSGGFRLGFIDLVGHEWPYDAQRAQDVPPDTQAWCPTAPVESQAEAVLRRLGGAEVDGSHGAQSGQEGVPDPREFDAELPACPAAPARDTPRGLESADAGAVQQTFKLYNIVAMGDVRLRGRRIVEDEWMLHAEDCRDCTVLDAQTTPYTLPDVGTFEQLRAEFDRDLGEQGFRFDEHVSLMPCVDVPPAGHEASEAGAP